jgi:hypothetical protein
MKKTNLISWGIIILVILAVVAYIIFPKQVKQAVGISYEPKKITLMGSASNLVSAPDVFVADNSTTTSATQYADGGHVIQQTVNTNGIEKGFLCYSALGGTATSTLYAKQMGSHDGSNFAAVGSTTVDLLATTTLNTLTKNYQFTPGTASTTLKCVPIDVDGYNYTRFMFKQDNVAGDTADGVQAWIYFVAKDTITR